MPNYRSYPSVSEQPKRKLRKSLRKTIFEENRLAGNRERKERRESKGKANA